MPQITIDADVLIKGICVPQEVTVPNNSIKDSNAIAAGANLSADKTEQRYSPSWSQPNSAATTETRTVFVARRAGTLNQFVAGSIAAAIGNSTVTLDLRKNGTTALTAVVTLDNANVARIVEAGAISGAGTFVAGDWFEVVLVATIGTGTLPTGVFCQLEADQNGA